MVYLILAIIFVTGMLIGTIIQMIINYKLMKQILDDYEYSLDHHGRFLNCLKEILEKEIIDDEKGEANEIKRD